MTEPPLKVIFLADTRPGRSPPTRGDCGAGAARRRHPCRGEAQMDRADALAPTPHHRQELLPAAHVAHGLSIDAYALPKADLVVSAGGETHMPNICVSRFLGIPSIFCGSLMRGLGPENFSLIVSSYDRDAANDRYLVVLKPSSMIRMRWGVPCPCPAMGLTCISSPRGPPRGRQCRSVPLSAERSGIGCSPSSPRSPRRGARVGWSRPRAARQIASPTRSLRAKDRLSSHASSITARRARLAGGFRQGRFDLLRRDQRDNIGGRLGAAAGTIGVAPRAHRFTDEERSYASRIPPGPSCKTAGAAFCQLRSLRLTLSPARSPRSSRSNRTRSMRWPPS